MAINERQLQEAAKAAGELSRFIRHIRLLPPASEDEEWRIQAKIAEMQEDIQDLSNHGITSVPATPRELIFRNFPDEPLAEGAAGRFYIKLSRQPSADVTVTIEDDHDAMHFSPAAPRTFTSANWDKEQQIAFVFSHDADTEDELVNIGFQVTGGRFEAASMSREITVADDDDQPV